MNQRKPNRIPWFSLVLSLLLCVGCVAVSAGSAFARYLTEREVDITFQTREPEQICLGTLDSDGSFCDVPPQMNTQMTPPQMDMAVSNGVSDEDCSRWDQLITLQIIAGPGVTTDTGAAPIYLILPGETEGSQIKVMATAIPIAEGTTIYHTYGDGWIYTFLDEEGKEFYWTLPGGEFSFVSLTVTMDELPSIPTLIQPQVTGWTVSH